MSKKPEAIAAGRSAEQVFADQRPRLRLLAYRLLGGLADADDVVQDAWLKWNDSAVRALDPPAFLTAMVGRLALDRLRKQKRRAVLAAQYLPDPWIEAVDEGEADLSTGLMVLLERLSPDQRAVFVLREAMDLDFADIARILDKEASTCRSIMTRARAALKGGKRFAPDAPALRDLSARFAAACSARDYSALAQLLSSDAVLISNGGKKVRAARNPIRSADHAARFLVGVLNKFVPADFTLRAVEFNGLPGLVGEAEGKKRWMLSFDAAENRIHRIYLLVDPDRID